VKALGLALAFVLVTAAAASAYTITSALYSFDDLTHRFTGTGWILQDGSDARLSVTVGPEGISGTWEGAGFHGAVLGGGLEAAPEDGDTGLFSHAWLIFTLIGPLTGEWWAFVNLQDPLGPPQPDGLFTTTYTDIAMPLNSYLLLDDARVAVPEPSTLLLVSALLLPALIGVVMAHLIRASWRATP
jgi:hypothetical protein